MLLLFVILINSNSMKNSTPLKCFSFVIHNALNYKHKHTTKSDKLNQYFNTSECIYNNSTNIKVFLMEIQIVP